MQAGGANDIADIQIMQTFRSKQDWHYFLSVTSKSSLPSNLVLHFVEGFYLPDYKDFDLGFLKQIISGEKKLVKRSDLMSVVVPAFKEFTVDKLYEMMKDDEKALSYLPTFDETKRQRPNRTFVFNVVNTIHQSYISQCSERAIQARATIKPRKEFQEPLQITDEFREIMLSAAHMTSKYP